MPYSETFKRKMVQKMTGPKATSAGAPAREVNVAQTILSRWLRQASSAIDDFETNPDHGGQGVGLFLQILALEGVQIQRPKLRSRRKRRSGFRSAANWICMPSIPARSRSCWTTICRNASPPESKKYGRSTERAREF